MIYGHEIDIMEMLDMAGKLLKNILPDKMVNRETEI